MLGVEALQGLSRLRLVAPEELATVRVRQVPLLVHDSVVLSQLRGHQPAPAVAQGVHVGCRSRDHAAHEQRRRPVGLVLECSRVATTANT
jgi:hypothetical protein